MSIQKGNEFGIHDGDDLHSIEDKKKIDSVDTDEDFSFPLSQYNLNYVFDSPDNRDYKFKSLLEKAIDPASLPEKIDLRSQWGDILDQGSLGSCVSNSVAYQLRYLLKKQTGIVKNMSRLFIYYNGRLLAGLSVNEDTGLTMRGGFQSVASKGTIEETLFPYIILKYKDKPSDSLYAIAEQYKNIKYYSVEQDLNALKKCLKDGFLISFGLTLFSSFMSSTVAKTGKVPVPNENVDRRVGGHAMTILGYDNNLSSFIVANNWGKNWGANGFCFIPYSIIINSKWAGDFWTARSYSIETNVPNPSTIPVVVPVVTEPVWTPGTLYKKDDVVQYMNVKYKCRINHKSITVWNPPVVPALWIKI